MSYQPCSKAELLEVNVKTPHLSSTSTHLLEYNYLKKKKEIYHNYITQRLSFSGTASVLLLYVLLFTL